MSALAWAGLALAALAVGGGAYIYTPDRPRAALEALYAPPPSRFLDVAGLRLHVRDTGPRDAPPLLLLHGFASSLHTWEEWAGLLEAERRVIRIDLPGFGLTGRDPTGDYSDARAVTVLRALLEALDLPQVDLAGSSMGGRIAWRFAAAEPARVRRLVLMAPDGFETDPARYGRPGRAPPLLYVLPYALPKSALAGATRPAYADPAALTPERLERYYAMMLAPGVRTAIRHRVAGHVPERPEPLLRSLTMPVLLLWGAADRMIPASHAADYAALLADSRTVVLPGIGHVPMEEDPAGSLAPMRDFLR